MVVVAREGVKWDERREERGKESGEPRTLGAILIEY